MSYTFTLSKDAENDIESAYSWYELQYKGLGNKFINALESAFTSIQFNPQLYGFRRKNVRGCIVKGFPYVVLFFIARNKIHVKAVFHTRKK